MPSSPLSSRGSCLGLESGGFAGQETLGTLNKNKPTQATEYLAGLFSAARPCNLGEDLFSKTCLVQGLVMTTGIGSARLG